MTDAAMDLVIAVMKVVHEAGGKIAMAAPYEDDSGLLDVQIMLSHRPLDKNGDFLPGRVPKTPKDDEKPPTIIYVVDRSGSMTACMDMVKYSLKRSLNELPEEEEFHVIFFSSGPPVEMPSRRLVNATVRNKQLASEFIDSIICQNKADPTQAIERAFACRPDIIYILTDGDFGVQSVDLINRLNADKKVIVRMIQFGGAEGAVLKEIGEEDGGLHPRVPEKDLANLGK